MSPIDRSVLDDSPPEGPDSGKDGGLTRRHLVQRASIAAAMASPLVLAACGGSNSSSSSSGGGGSSGGSGQTALGKQLNKYVGPGGPDNGEGTTWNFGASLPLSGAGAFFGHEMEHGMDLAVDHIKQAGGPDFAVSYEDNKTGDPNAGIQNVRELGINGVAGMMASYLADFGAELPGIAAYKILTIDPGGGTGGSFQEEPYFWGSRALWPEAPFPGVYKYVSEAKPEFKRVSLLIWDNGASFVNPAVKALEEAIKPHGLELVSVEKSAAGSTDFSTTIARLKSANPDVIQVAMSGADVAYFLKGKAAGGLTAQAIGADWNPETQKTAGSTADGFWFSFDYINPKNPPNPWAKIFFDEYKKKFGSEATWLAANYYESTFIYWELIRRVLAEKGDINDGTALQSALEADPEFPSLYGGNSGEAGTLTFDPKTHTIAKREISLLELEPSGEEKVLATFGLGGADYKRVA
jgi:branched-chain amino acid transport system substrate-binding protein